MLQPGLAASAGAGMSQDLFDGPLREFAGSVLSDEVGPTLGLSELLRDESLDRLLLRVYGAELFASQKPVLVSQWSKYVFMQLIPPVLVASLVHGVGWPLGLDRLRFALDERGLLDGVRFDGEPVAVTDSPDPFQRFAALLDCLQQVVERLSAHGSVAPGVLWGNAGDYLETCLRRLSEVSDVPLAAGYGLLQQRSKPDGRRNPLFNAVLYIEGADGRRVRQRRSCCLSHRVEWVGRCEHCPLEG
ncbi:siderophore-iron reductase FhuF [Pseudomonas sp. NPDC090202]|uniref:siderophore-iron reductase FhuF n=1 Tax=unclassified Pseudomonas TaxID=196821 RepID=UPI00380B74D0